jgi:hypothetical protein
VLVRAIGVPKFREDRIPKIDYAHDDAADVAGFLDEAVQRQKRLPHDRIDLVVKGASAPSREIRQVFDGLVGEIRQRSLGAGDTVFLVVESHVVDFGPRGTRLLDPDTQLGDAQLGADAQLERLEKSSISADAIAQSLEEVARQGCLVVLLLDGIHDPIERLPVRPRRDLIDWVRKLWHDCGVIVLLASKQEKSVRLQPLRHGAFAQAVLQSATVAGGASGAAVSPSLEEFSGIVLNRVSELTGRKQVAGFYYPEHLDPSLIRIFEPQARPVENLAGNLPQPVQPRVIEPLAPRAAGAPR